MNNSLCVSVVGRVHPSRTSLVLTNIMANSPILIHISHNFTSIFSSTINVSCLCHLCPSISSHMYFNPLVSSFKLWFEKGVPMTCLINMNIHRKLTVYCVLEFDSLLDKSHYQVGLLGEQGGWVIQ